jgi:hypothetical protein
MLISPIWEINDDVSVEGSGSSRVKGRAAGKRSRPPCAGDQKVSKIMTLLMKVFIILNLKMMLQVSAASFDIGALKDQAPCRYCGAFLWPGETSTACCNNGKLFDVNNPSNEDLGMKIMPDLPQQISDMMTRPAFVSKLRAYNNALAMASVGGNAPEQGVNFKIQGKLYHRIGSIGPPPAGEVPRFAALYFHDSDHETENRLHHQSQTLNPEIISVLQAVIRDVNPYVNSFRQALELHNGVDDVKIVLLADPKKKAMARVAHPGCLTLPQGCEVFVWMS